MEDINVELGQETQVDEIKLGNELTFCFICGSKECLPNENNNFCSDTENTDNYSSAISQQLNVIFILKHLLQVPSSSLQTYLVKLGNPTKWQINLCSHCTQLINQAKDLHFLILKISSKLKNVQKEIVDKAKLHSASPDNLDHLNNNLVYKETRQFVENHNYDDLFREDPILEGNQLVTKLLDEAAGQNKVKIEVDLDPVEETFPEPDDNHDDGGGNWIPSPNPIKGARSPRKRKPRNIKKDPKQSKSKDKRQKNGRPSKNPAEEPQIMAGCDKCNFKGSSVTNLFKHLEEEHPFNKEIRCPFEATCEVTVKSAVHWRSHKSYHKRTMTTCHLCGLMILSLNFEMHMARKHKGEEGGATLLRCRVVGCDGRHLTKEGLEKHMKKMHGGGGGGEEGGKGKEIRYWCSFCGKGFFSRRHMTRHEMMHSNKESKPFPCDICGKRFAIQGYVHEHKKYVHWGTRIRKTPYVKKKDKGEGKGGT